MLDMDDAMHPETLCYFAMQGIIIDEKDFFGWNMGCFEGQQEDVAIRFAEMNDAGRDEEIYQRVESKGADTMIIQFARLIADRHYLY